MARAATSHKRLFLRVLFKQAQDNGDTLYNVLLAAGTARVEQNLTGRVLVGHAANGHTHTWQMPGDFSASDAATLASEMLDRYDEANEKLVETDDIASPTDTQIFNEMMDKLRPVRSLVETHYNGRVEPEEITT